MQKKTQNKTYLQQSLRKGKTMRWMDSAIPLKVYIAPFRFYSKAHEDYKYRDMVLRALDTWQKASAGRITFSVVNALLESQINIDWKRVDRKALGHCYFQYDAQSRLFSAEVQIGISDGLIHKDYMAEDEVYHTILHEIGHALGLGHSPYEQDIMYTPHRYGIINLSSSDKLTLQWLYKLPLGTVPSEYGARQQIHSSDLDFIVAQLMQKQNPSKFEEVKNNLSVEQKDLLQEQENIANLKKYNLALQNVKISDDIRKFFVNPPLK